MATSHSEKKRIEINPYGWQGVPVIIGEVAKNFGITVAELKGPSRMKTITLARHVAMFLIRELTGLSWPEIGDAFKREHSTAMAGAARVQREMKEEKQFLARIAYLRSKFVRVVEDGVMTEVLSDFEERFGESNGSD